MNQASRAVPAHLALHYNAARAYFDKGDMEKCREHLAEAQRLNPDHEEVKKFLEFLNKK